MTRNKYGLPTGLKSDPVKKQEPKMNLDTFKKIRNNLTMGENLVEAPNQNPYFQNVATGGKDVSGPLAVRKKDSTSIKKSEGGKLVKNKGGALAKKNRPTVSDKPDGPDKDSADNRRKKLEKRNKDRVQTTKGNLKSKAGKVAGAVGKVAKVVGTVAKVAYKGAKMVGSASKAFDPKGGTSWESYIQRSTQYLMEDGDKE